MLRRILLFLAAILVMGAAAFVISRRDNGSVEVEVERAVRNSRFLSYVTASGEIVATRYADIGSDLMGKVTHLPVSEGEPVKKGQLLARIDPVQARTDLTAAEELVRALEAEESAGIQEVERSRFQVARAEASLREARINLERLQKLFADGVAPRAELDTVQATYDTVEADLSAARAGLELAEKTLQAAGRRVRQAKAQRERAQDLFSKTEIRSPIDGVVSRLQVREGEMVVIGIQNQPGTTLMTISDLSGINAEVKVAEADILRIEPGQRAEIVLDAVPAKVFGGEVIEVGTSALPTVGTGVATREFRVVIRMEDPDPGMRPGLTCDAEILTTELENVLTVPLQSVVLRQREGVEQTGVFLAGDGKAEFTPVRAGVIGGLEIVVEGIDEGAPVITGPYQVLRDLKDGSRIRTATATE